MSTNNYHTRINDNALSFGMVRYSTGDKDTDKSLWKMVISDFCGSKTHTSLEINISDLQRIKCFCDKAIQMLETDGDRKTNQQNPANSG